VAERVDASSKGRTHYKKWRKQASDYLGQWDLQTADHRYIEPVVVIEAVEFYRPDIIRKRKQPDGTYKDEVNNKYLITFAGKRKRWIAGPVSQDAIAKLHGKNLEEWIGKKIRIYVDHSVEMSGARVGGIRVRNTIPGEEPTSDPLEKPVDDAAADRMDQAFGRSEFEEGTEATHGA
jgi:hypothetical protein